jgi:MFS family permease
MAPGFVLDKIVAWLGKWLNFVSLVVMGLGLVLMALKQAPVALLWVGAILTGLGYGVMQPVIYDKAATNAPPRLSTLALSLVMVVNYLAILVAPFIIDATDDIFHATHHRLAYLVNGVLTFVLAIITLFMLRRSPVFGSDD